MKIALAALALPLLAGCPGQTSDSKLQTKISELASSLPSLSLSSDDRAELSKDLDGLSKDIGKGRENMALYDLQAVWSSYGVAAFCAKHAAAAKDEALYTQIWKDQGSTLPEAAKRSNQAQPLLARGLAEFARDQANGFYMASEAYGKQTTLQDGLAYFGLSRGLLAYANFCDAVSLQEGRSPKLRSMAGELDDLESRELAAFENAKSSEDSTFIAMSQSIKTARELDDRKWYAGEAIAYLDADLGLEARNARPLTRSEILERLQQERTSWSSKVDNSIPRYYVELATSELDQSSEGLSQASAICTATLPRYHRILEPAAARPTLALSAKRVKITLVRWPYT